MDPSRHPQPDYLTQTDGMFWETSIKLARAQIARQIQNRSTVHRQRQSRVHKPMSTGDSPQNMYRKRTGSQQRSNPHHYSSNPPPPRCRAITAGTSPLPPQQRPITWHAQTTLSVEGSAYHRHSMYEPPDRMVPSQVSALQAIMPQALQPRFDQQQVDQYISYPGQSYLAAEYTHVPISSDWFTEQPQTPYSTSAQVSTMPLSGQMEHAHDEGRTTRNYIDASIPPSSMKQQPRFSPITSGQRSMTSPDALHANGPDARLEADGMEDGLELVGLGLYDRPAQTSSLSDGTARHSPNNTGRGLKLEDAWTPPDDDGESSDDGHGENEDQGGDEDEDSELQDDDSDLELARYAVPDVYSSGNHLPDIDLSNKSFLFVNESDAVLGATALANLTTANWDTTSQAWAS